MQKILNKTIKYSIYLLVFLMPLFFLPFSFEVFEFNKQYLLFFFVSIAFLAWLGKMVLVDREIRFRWSSLDIFVLAFLLVSVLSAVFSVNKNASLFGFYARFSDGLIGLLSLAVMYFLITNNVGLKIKNRALKGEAGDEGESFSDRQKSKLKSTGEDLEIEEKDGKLISTDGLIKIFLYSAVFVVLFSYFSIFGLWQKISGFIALPFVMRQVIFNPTAGSLEGLAMFLAIVIVFLIGITLAWQKEQKIKKAEKIGVYFLLLAVFGLLAIINFNSAWLAILLGLILFLVVALQKRIFREEINRLLVPIIFIFLSFSFLFINSFEVQRLVLGYDLPEERVLGQQTSWSISLKASLENVKSVFLGSGPGTFHYDFARFKPAEFNQTDIWQIRFDRSGNHLSEILATSGFLGFFSYLALIGVFLLTSWFALASSSSKIKIPLLMAFLALLFGQFVFYQNTILAFAFWFFLGLSAVSWQKPLKEKIISFKEFPEMSLIFSVLFIVFSFLVLAGYFFGARFYLADINYRNYFQEGREESLSKAAELNPFQPQYKIILARSYLNKIIEEGQKPIEQIDEVALSNNIYLAINFAREATEITPNRVFAWETLGMIYREIQGVAAGATEWGIKSFEKAIVLEPINPVLHTELGKFYLVLGEIEKAKDRFNKAKELMPGYADASLQMAFIHEYEGRTEEAVRQMEELFSFYPYNVEIIFQLGRFYLNNNQIDEAISQFEWALQIFPNHSNSIYSLGAALQRKGETDKAITALERVLELNPGNENIIQKLEELRREKEMTELTEEEMTSEESGEEMREEEMREETERAEE